MTVLNLQKGNVLDLTKQNPTLNQILVGAGWDVKQVEAKGFFGRLLATNTQDFDLDLFAIKLDGNGAVMKNGLVYFGEKEHTGILLHGDNLTGEGDGDDEKISLRLNEIPSTCQKIVFGVAIYSAEQRNQTFSQVENAYVRLVDEANGNREICRFNLSNDGADHTGILMSELTRVNNEWTFKALGQYYKGSISTAVEMYR